MDRQRIVFIGDIEEQSIREACIGAAEFAAEQADLDFEPWPLFSREFRPPQPSDLALADSLLLTGRAYQVVFGDRTRPKMPYVFLLGTTPHRRAPSVEVDEFQVGRMAAVHLAERGYRELACIIPADMGWAETRAAGFRRTCGGARNSCRIFRLPVDILPIYWRPKIAQRHEQLRQILAGLPKPCGVFAANDVIACFIIETARSCGLSVPADIGVVGVDDDPVPNAAAGMAISSVQLPFRDLGRQAAMLLRRRMRGDRTPFLVSLPPIRVLVRASTDAFMVDDPLVQKSQAYIEAHRDRPVRVAEVVRLLQTTKMTLGKHFQRHLHLTPRDYILRRRVAYAAELLRDGRLNVAQVSDGCGFHNCSYFCKIFKRTAGVSPGSLRRPFTK